MKIYGLVQGVFFRAGVYEKAKALGLKGWVRNERDESVKVVAEGKEKSLQDLIDWCHHGPPSAKVDRVEITRQEAKGEFELFEIRYY